MLLSYYCLRHFVELWALTNWELIPEKEKQPIIEIVNVHIDQVWVLCKAITLETFKMWSLKAIITTIHPCQTCVRICDFHDLTTYSLQLIQSNHSNNTFIENKSLLIWSQWGDWGVMFKVIKSFIQIEDFFQTKCFFGSIKT